MNNVRVTIDEAEYIELKECKRLRDENLVELVVKTEYEPCSWERSCREPSYDKYPAFKNRDDLLDKALRVAVFNVESRYKDELESLKKQLKNAVEVYQNKNWFERLFKL